MILLCFKRHLSQRIDPDHSGEERSKPSKLWDRGRHNGPCITYSYDYYYYYYYYYYYSHYTYYYYYHHSYSY